MYFAGKFHKVLFLAPGGKTVFQGTVPDAENYFDNLGFEKPAKVNPADFYMDVIGGMCERKKSRPVSETPLSDHWEQYASENNAGAKTAENASGEEVTEKLSFNISTEGVMKQNQGTVYTIK